MVVETLNAEIRKEKGKKVRKQGFVPAVIYGQGMQTVPVKLNNSELTRVLKKHGDRARIKLKINNEEKTGIIKDVDTHPVTSVIQNVDIQIVEKDEKVNWEIPIIFSGKDMLEINNLLLQVDIEQIKVTGEASEIPDTIKIDVSNKKVNDIITIADLNLNPSIVPFKSSDTVLAIIKSNTGKIEEDNEEEELSE